MSTFANDAATDDTPWAQINPRAASGLSIAVVSAITFGMAGALAKPLLEVGWSAGSVAFVRIAGGALMLAPFGAHAMRGQWHLLRANAGLILMYGLLAVAAAQFCFFSAVNYMQVGPALLIEYTAPAAIVVWLWLRHSQRPARLTLAGAAVAGLGLLLVLDIFSGADISLIGVLWALGAMVGLSTYFLISADVDTGLPPMALATGGLIVGAVAVGALGAVGLLPMTVTAANATYAGIAMSWWWPVLLLALASAAISYTTGIVASRILGSRLASFVALSEVVAGVLWAWLLVGELPAAIQLAGGLLILIGVIGVKLGERDTERVEPVPA